MFWGNKPALEIRNIYLQSSSRNVKGQVYAFSGVLVMIIIRATSIVPSHSNPRLYK